MNIGGPANQVLLLAKGLAPEFTTLLAAGSPGEREGELTDPQVPVRPRPSGPPRPTRDRPPRGHIDPTVGERQRAVPRAHPHGQGGQHWASCRTELLQVSPAEVGAHVPWPCSPGLFGGAQQRRFLQMERFLARRTDALVAVSPEVRDELVDLGVGKPSQYLVIPLGLDLDRFSVVGSRGGAPGQLRRALGSAPGRPWPVPSEGWCR